MEKQQQNRRKLSRIEVLEIKRRLSGKVDRELTDILLGGCNVYRLCDGSILVVSHSGKGWLYPSRAEVLQLWSELAAAPPQHCLAGRLLHEMDFPSHVEELIGQLLDFLSLTGSELDRSRESLSNIDKAVLRIGTSRCLKPDVFSGLTAYLGETAKAITGGNWEMRLAADNKTWEPWIVSGYGQSFAPFMIVYRELAESGGSIQGAFLL